MRTTLILPALLLTAAARTAQPQERDWSPEIRPFVGAYVPLGAQRSDFKTAAMVGGQAAIELNRYLHVVAALGWTDGRTKLFTRDRTQIWQYDVGTELNAVRELGRGWLFRPFLGAGAGGRTYNYKEVGAGTTSCLAGYGTLGTEFQTGIIALRAEARNYLSCFESPISGKKRTRNDLGLSLGFAYHIR